jgi:hypothetical protein
MRICRRITGLFLLTVCSASCQVNSSQQSVTAPETVLVTYHVVPGKEQELRSVLDAVWNAYRQQGLVYAHPHLIVQATEDGNKTRFVEAFSWVSHDAPVRASVSVKDHWDQMKSLCEKRDGHDGIEGGEVGLISPSSPD